MLMALLAATSLVIVPCETSLYIYTEKPARLSSASPTLTALQSRKLYYKIPAIHYNPQLAFVNIIAKLALFHIVSS